MSEEEAIKILNTYKGNLSQQKKNPKITKAIDRIIDALEEKNIFLDLYNKEKEKNNRLQTNYEILQGEIDRIGIDTLGLEKGNSTDDVIEEIKLLLKEKESNREAIQYCKKDLAFKKRLEKAKDTIDNYNAGRFDTSESILNILEE